MERALQRWIADFLAGQWRLERTVSGLGTMSGLARFEPRPDAALAYREEGMAMLETGAAFAFHRNYRYETGDSGFAVYFDEQPARLFQRVILSPTGNDFEGTAQHLCPPDHYQSHYVLRPDGSFSILHEVRGPKKQYAIRSLFERVR